MRQEQNLEADIESLEKEIEEKKKALTELRRKRPRKEVEDYVFKDANGQDVTLSELFQGENLLILIQNMGEKCSYCTMWADGFNGIFEYVQGKAGFALASPDSPDVQKKIRSERGWRFPMVSTDGTSFKRDTGFENEKEVVYPGVSVFQKNDDGTFSYTNHAGFGPGDDFCSVWHFFDLLPSKK